MADAADNNPLLADFEFPPYDVIQPAHVRPGIRALLAGLEGELEELEKGVEPAWQKLVDPLERIVDRLDVVWNIVDHLMAVRYSADLRAAVEDVQPDKVKFQLRLGQSKPIYEAFCAIRSSSEWDSLSDARKRVVEGQLKYAILGGVALEHEQREKFNQIQQELEQLSEKFSENLLAATKKFEKLITDKKEIDGLPSSALRLAAQTAVSKGHENASAYNGPWVITLDTPSFTAVMQHAKNRGLREEIYHAYLTRASSGELDNTHVIRQILKLRLEKAKLLGYKNYAEVSMTQRMATADRVHLLLEKIRAASWDHAVEDMEDLKAFVEDSGSAEANDLSHWDLDFWSERLRESKYDIDEEGLRPYFALPNVMDGLFRLANKLFGINIEPADGLAPVWNSDVRFYRVKDSSNTTLAYFYFDPYSRPSEKGHGAWMDVVYSRSRVLARSGSSVRLPVAHIVCNQMPPVGDKPSLMIFREVEAVFHEFGQALQHMLTTQDEAFVAGTNGIEWDARALPSQFMEIWCYNKEVLLSIAKHYRTGELLPEEIYANLVAARKFRAGTFSLRQLRFATVDMELHTTYDPTGPVSVYDVDRRVAERTQVLAPLPEDRFLCGFSHIFAGVYAAGYYSYKWAEVLSADAFSSFEYVGLNNWKAIEETGRRFRETILALGGGKSALEVFVSFRGREPSPVPLLRHSGLLRDNDTLWMQLIIRLDRIALLLNFSADALTQAAERLDKVTRLVRQVLRPDFQPQEAAAAGPVFDTIDNNLSIARAQVSQLFRSRTGPLIGARSMLGELIDSKPCEWFIRDIAEARDPGAEADAEGNRTEDTINALDSTVQVAMDLLSRAKSKLRLACLSVFAFDYALGSSKYGNSAVAANNACEAAEEIGIVIGILEKLYFLIEDQPPAVANSLGYRTFHEKAANVRKLPIFRSEGSSHFFDCERSTDQYCAYGIGYQSGGATKTIDIPNGRVGVIIGKSGETIRHLQFQSGAKIQVTSVNAHSSLQTRSVCLSGIPYQIRRAEKLISDLLAKFFLSMTCFSDAD